MGSARLQVLAAAILFSTGGAGIKAEAFSGVQVSALRSGVAAIALFALLKGRLRVSTTVLGVGAVYGATLTAFVLATKLTTAANAIFLQATAPLYLLLLSPFVLGERIGRRDLVYLAGVGVGLAFCVLGRPVATATAPNPSLGNAIGVLCSVVWALTLLGLRYLERDPDREGAAMAAVVAGNALASQMIEPQRLAHAPGDHVIGARGIAADTNGADNFAVALERNAAGKDHYLPIVAGIDAEELPARLAVLRQISGGNIEGA